MLNKTLFFFLQVDSDLTANDDKLVQSVLNVTEKLNNTVLSIASTFTYSDTNTIGPQLVADVCQVINKTIKQMFSVIDEKACKIEDDIQMLPSMKMFDKFAVKGCGQYCLKNCDYGFPNLILEEMKVCLNDRDRKMKNNDSSDSFIQVFFCSLLL